VSQMKHVLKCSYLLHWYYSVVYKHEQLFLHNLYYRLEEPILWPPYVIGQAITFLPCGFFFLSSSLLLGIDVTDTLSTAAYVDRLLMQVNQRLYLLSLLQSSGLQCSSLHLLFNALVINKLTYSLMLYPCMLLNSLSMTKTG